MGPTVMKFGGTSVQDAAALERLSSIVRGRLPASPLIVVSALGGMTDALLRAVRAAAEGEVEAVLAELAPQLERHGEIARQLLGRGEADSIVTSVRQAEEEIGTLLRVVRAHPGTRRPLQDEVVSYGERLSSALVAAVLPARDVAARLVDARRCIRTSEDHTRGVPLLERTNACARAELEPLLERGEVPVLGGFIGSAENGATVTLGRGGSDYSAALLGAALGAREIQIWTDVTGFLTADPRVVAHAQPIPRLSYAEAAELAFFGAKVLHPKTIQPAVEQQIPVRICNSRAADLPGTLINGQSERLAGSVKAIAHRTGITLVHISSAGMLGAYGFLHALFDVFNRHRTGVDVVTTSEVSVSLSLESTERLPAILDDLAALGSVRVAHGNAIVCVVGAGIGETPGVAARVFGTVADTNVALISQGASSINLTFVVAEEAVEEVVRRLHDTFFGPAEDASVLLAAPAARAS